MHEFKLVQEGIMVGPRKVVSRGAGGASGNNASTWTRLATIALAVGMMAALAAPAWGQSDDVTLRRDGSKAVPLGMKNAPAPPPAPPGAPGAKPVSGETSRRAGPDSSVSTTGSLARTH